MLNAVWEMPALDVTSGTPNIGSRHENVAKNHARLAAIGFRDTYKGRLFYYSIAIFRRIDVISWNTERLVTPHMRQRKYFKFKRSITRTPSTHANNSDNYVIIVHSWPSVDHLK